jgi:hypothetical protein
MTLTDYALAILSACGGLAGLVLLFAVWRKPGRPLLLGLGWALVTASLVIWFLVNLDRGVAQVSSLLMLLVAFAITWPGLKGVNGLQAPVRVRKVALARPSASQLAVRIGSGVWTFLLAGPIAGAIALYAGGALLRATAPDTGNPANAAVSAYIISLFLWALISTLLLMEKHSLRRTLYAGGALAVVLCAALL